ncbi:MAG: selenide, water dikinase SelD [Bacteroidetes bacterium]|nr:selenide, water dikinase SelD [Bacteroidota bacterium]
MNPIYLDYNATTPVDPLAFAEMKPFLENYFGNPSSIHEFGLITKRAVEKARSQVSRLLNANPDEIVFTGGGTESNNMALKGVAFALRSKGNHIITSVVEHPAVLEVCHYLENNGFQVTYLDVDETGMVDPQAVMNAITPKTILISIMHANNEVGTIQPVEEIGKIARSYNILFHTDAAQSVGKIPVNVEAIHADLLSVAGHKLYAPKGIGVLFIRRGVKLEKLIHGANHESNLRAGTENVSHIVGLGAAADLIQFDSNGRFIHFGEISEIEKLRNTLFNGIINEIPEIRLNGHPDLRLPNTASIGFPGTDATFFLNGMREIAASAGAACHSDRDDISAVLVAMHVPLMYAIGTIRFSVGRMTICEEIDRAIPIIVNAYRKLKGRPVAIGFKELISENPANDLSAEIAPSLQNVVYGANEYKNPYVAENSKSEIRNPKSEIRNQKSEIRNQKSEIRLTEFTHALGCACKIRPQLLEKILKQLPRKSGANVLIGYETSDDAAVYAVDRERAIVQTVDFIPPIVDDPYMFGAIAAANAISDVYAMGGTPAFALSIVGFPDRLLPLETLGEILRGASDKAAEAGIEIIGGHTIEDQEPKFGLVVTGFIHPDKILRNSTAKVGDVLILTKPIGTGIIMTAMKRGLTEPAEVDEAIGVMAELNRKPAEIMQQFPVNACTDVTGFGLTGHLKEMVKGSGVSATIYANQVPLISSVMKHASGGTIPGGTKNNLEFVGDVIKWAPEVTELMKVVLCDAQTSGGLLISLPEAFGEEFIGRLREAGVTKAVIIGKIVEGNGKIVCFV